MPLNFNFDAVFWDVDGTLVDSESIAAEAIIAVHKEHGSEISIADTELMIGHSKNWAWEWIQKHKPIEINYAAWAKATDEYFSKNFYRIQPVSGAIEAIRFFYENNIPQAAVSNGIRRDVEASINALNIKDMLVFVQSIEDVNFGKPHPEPYLLAAEKLAVIPKNCLVFEDSNAGATAAKSAGMQVIMVSRETGIDINGVIS